MNTTSFFYFAAFVVSFLLYITTPVLYNHSFCICCFLIFLLVSALTIAGDLKRIGFLNFNLLFLFSFFACTYVYPVFLVEGESLTGPLITDTLNTLNTLNRCVALCTLAITIYTLAYNHVRNNGEVEISKKEKKKSALILSNLKMPMIIICLAMIVVLYNFKNTVHDVSIEVNDSPLLFTLFELALVIYLVCSALCIRESLKVEKVKTFICENKFILFLLALILILFLVIGDRAPILFIGFSFIGVISLFVKKLGAMRLLSLGALGVLLMFALQVTRGGVASLGKGNLKDFWEVTHSSLLENASVWDVMSDLAGRNIELNAGMDFVDKNGLLYPFANAMADIAAPIPFLPSFLTQLFYGKYPGEMSPQQMLSEYTNSSAGNHCVIDTYMAFGEVGVVLVFVLLGLLIGKVSNGLNSNLFSKIFYVYLISSAVFMARNSMVFLYRSLFLSFVLYYILLKVRMCKRIY